MASDEVARRFLTRQVILEAALRLVDEHGLAALSFRRLAEELGVTPMALYRYVQSKEDLLDGLCDLGLGMLELPSAEHRSWLEQLRDTARSYRELILAHPSLAALMGRPLFAPGALRLAEYLLGVLRRAGFDHEEAVRVYLQLTRFIVALVMLEVEGPRRPAEQQAQLSTAMRIRLETLPPGEFPQLVQSARYLAAPLDSGHVFESGLDLLLAGVQACLARESVASGGPAREGGART